MLQRNRLMLSCALSALLLSAGAATAQTQAPPPSTNNNTAPATENTADQAKRANETKQNTNAASASAIETVTVTAEHRADPLQKLAIAASVYTDERRNLVGIETASDIINFTPSASLNGEFLAIRGVSRANTSAFGSDSGVAVLVDGIYTPSPDYLNQPDFFADRIEVLRGPQGTLGGQNDIGGSVNVVEKRPTDEFHEEFRYSINNYYNQTADASISGPITDNLRFRIADSLNWAPSWAGPEKNLDSNTYPGSGLGNLFEGQLDWTPFSNLDVWFKVQNNANDYKAYYGVNPDQYPLYPPNPYLGYANCPTINGAVLQCLVPYPQDLQSPTSNPQIHNPFVVNVNTTGYTKLRNDWTYTTQVNWQLNGATVEYIGGYSQYNYLSEYDADDTSSSSLQNAGGIFPTGFLAQTQVADQAEQWYQNEIDVKSDNDSAFKWLVGVFQYRNHYRAPFAYEEPNNPTLANVTPANPSRAYYSQTAELTDKSEAVYGNLDYDLTDTIRLTGGLRYNWDDKAGNLSYREIFDTAGIFYCPTTCAPTDLGTVTEASTNSTSDWTGKVGAEWRPDADTLAYLTFAKGYKSGGLALLDVQPIPKVGPETLYDYEGGIKRTFWDELVVNASAYYYDYRNLQQLLSVENPTTSIVATELVSAQRARSYGFELESVWSPTADFNLTFNYSYLNARFTQFSLPNGQQFVDFSQLAPGCVGSGNATQPGQCNGVSHANLNGNVIPQSPANKVLINPVYTMHFDFGDVTGSATYAWIDSQYYSIFNNSGFQAPSYYNLDLRMLYQPPGGNWTFILFARNVTDQLQITNYSTGAFQYGPPNLVKAPAGFPSSGQVFYSINPPRTFGAEVQLRF